MEVKFKALTYEEARAEHFEALKNKAERKMIYWAARLDRSRPNNLADPAYIKASEFGAEYNFYKDALEALAAQPKWISVVERLPEDEVIAANFAPGTHGYKEYILGYVCPPRDSEPGGCYATNDYEILRNVTHWMPLPTGPEEE